MISSWIDQLSPLWSAAEDTEGSDPPATQSEDGEEFAPNEWTVRQLLEDHAGAMWQNDIRGQTGWSASKTSRVLSEMEETGTIERQRIGREKVVTLTDHDAPPLSSEK